MLRLVVLAGLLTTAAWFAREGGWLNFPLQVSHPDATPYERYSRTLEDSGLANTRLGREWLNVSNSAIARAKKVSLPTQDTITFSRDLPSASAFRVALKRGQRVEVLTRAIAAAPTQTFIDVFEASSDTDADPALGPEHGALGGLGYEAEDDRELVIRVQPELMRSGTLDVTLRAAPALRFPVANARPRDLQSIFGDPRDAGRRRHEGVDIFANRGTPVVSSTDGVVMRVGESGLGGRIVWVWDPTRNLRLYYAHLDEQRVSMGERVSAGEVLGTVGNTGNARTTAPHLHFGIYAPGIGAIDPYWFIAPPVAADADAAR